MANLLFLPHRLPYPPDKGDKVRSFHLLRHLTARHRVYVGTFVDDPLDEPHVPALRALCADLHVERIEPRRARIASAAGLFNGEPLTMCYYRNKRLAEWVDRTITTRDIDAAVVFSSSMAPYLDRHPRLPALVDFVDVDSAKWREYAPRHRWPLSWIYAREARRLLVAERRIAARAAYAFFATAKEAALFHGLAPEVRAKVGHFDNGVDADRFAPDPNVRSPYAEHELPVVFTGAMDYWPNVDAVVWFASEVLTRLRERRPELRFHIVGRNPTDDVRALAGDAVSVSGTVPDVRPYLQHALAVVAPLRLARGIQNKILEAMAMGRPVVAAKSCVEAMTAVPGRELLAAGDADDWVAAVERVLSHPSAAAEIGAAARRCVLDNYSWPAHLATLDAHLAALTGAGATRSDAEEPAPLHAALP